MKIRKPNKFGALFLGLIHHFLHAIGGVFIQFRDSFNYCDSSLASLLEVLREKQSLITFFFAFTRSGSFSN